jgi:hypothetical protein
MKSASWRLRGGLATLVADPYRKLAAIVLAFLLWFFINDQIQDEVERTVSLDWGGSVLTGGESLNRLAVELPTDRVVGRRFMDGETQIFTATIVLRGPRFRIEDLRRADETLNLRIASFTGLDWESRRDVEFTAADIRRDISTLAGLEEIEMKPSRIRLEVERIADWDFVLSTDVVEIIDNQLGKRLRRETAEFSPRKARILGPASAIAQFRQPALKVLQAQLDSVASERRQVTVPLELTAAAREQGLRFAETPSVTFQVQPVTEDFQVRLPFVVDDLALAPEMRGLYQPEEPFQVVRISAGGQLRAQLMTFSNKQAQQEWASANLRLHVYIPQLEPGASYGPEIVREARLVLLGSLQATVDRAECLLAEPVSVTLRRQQ